MVGGSEGGDFKRFPLSPPCRLKTAMAAVTLKKTTKWKKKKKKEEGNFFLTQSYLQTETSLKRLFGPSLSFCIEVAAAKTFWPPSKEKNARCSSPPPPPFAAGRPAANKSPAPSYPYPPRTTNRAKRGFAHLLSCSLFVVAVFSLLRSSS